MLTCQINISNTPENVFDCSDCRKCEPTSVLNYPFQKDLKNSADFVQELKSYIENNTTFKCKDPEIVKNPDIRVIEIALNDLLICRIEAKYLEGKAFVKASKFIGLQAKETLVVDEPKLLHYFDCKKKDFTMLNREIPIFVVWKFDRPCNDIGGITIFQEVDILNAIYNKHPERCFDRESAPTDFDRGTKKGITKKYHFSIKETRPIWELVPKIFNIAKTHGLCGLLDTQNNLPIEELEPLQESIPISKNILSICIECKKTFQPKGSGHIRCYECWKSWKKNQ